MGGQGGRGEVQGAQGSRKVTLETKFRTVSKKKEINIGVRGEIKSLVIRLGMVEGMREMRKSSGNKPKLKKKRRMKKRY